MYRKTNSSHSIYNTSRPSFSNGVEVLDTCFFCGKKGDSCLKTAGATNSSKVIMFIIIHMVGTNPPDSLMLIFICKMLAVHRQRGRVAGSKNGKGESNLEKDSRKSNSYMPGPDRLCKDAPSRTLDFPAVA